MPLELAYGSRDRFLAEPLAGVESNQPVAPMAGNNANGMSSSQGIAFCGFRGALVGVIG